MSMKKYTDFYSVDSKKTNTNNTIKMKPLKEDILITPKTSSSIEILEDKIVKFNNIELKDILENLKSKYPDTDYYIRKKNNELHIVKYNENLKLDINTFVNTLLKFYSQKQNLRKITEGIKVKGNGNFCIIENMKSQYDNKFIEDLINLLTKKK